MRLLERTVQATNCMPGWCGLEFARRVAAGLSRSGAPHELGSQWFRKTARGHSVHMGPRFVWREPMTQVSSAHSYTV